MGGACSAYGREERRIRFSGRKPERRSPLVRPRRRWEYNIKLDLQDVGVGIWTLSSWLSLGTRGEHL